jgi:hypothetical protein
VLLGVALVALPGLFALALVQRSMAEAAATGRRLPGDGSEDSRAEPESARSVHD